MVTGEEFGDVEESIFSVPYKFYTLTRLRVWVSTKAILGFEATFSAPDNFTGYAPYTHMFGTITTPIEGYFDLNISEEIREVQLNFDASALR